MKQIEVTFANKSKELKDHFKEEKEFRKKE